MGQDDVQIDLIELVKYLISKWLIILLAILIGIGAAIGFSTIKNKNIYTAQMKLYITIPQTSDKIAIHDNVNELVADYIELLQSDLVVDKVSEELEIPVSEIRESINVSQVKEKRFIVITTQNLDKSKVIKISDSVLKYANKTITEVLDKNKPIVVEKADQPSKVNTVNTKKNIAVGAAAGLILSIGGIFVFFIYNKSKCKG